jgi:Protein kinase domain
VQPLLPTDPQQVGPYRLVKRLGSGGMGNVYLGYSRTGRPVAVKVIRPDIAEEPGFRKRFRREVQLAMSVSAFWTAAVVDADPEGEMPWVASQFVAGPPLDSVVGGQGPLDAATVRFLGIGLAEALAAFHARGLVHRDLKPANILLAEDGPRVIDFGISKTMDGSSGATTIGTTMGTPGFMSPERVVGTPEGTASDIFSLGSVLVYAATGTGPFGDGAFHALLFRVVHDEPDLGSMPEELRPIAASCLAKQPEQRPDAQTVVDRLAVDHRTGGPPPGWPAVSAAPEPAEPEPAEPLPAASEPAGSEPAEPRPAEPGQRSLPPPATPSGAFGPPPQDVRYMPAGPGYAPAPPMPRGPNLQQRPYPPAGFDRRIRPAPGPVFIAQDGGGAAFRRRMRLYLIAAVIVLVLGAAVGEAIAIIAMVVLAGVILLIGIMTALPYLPRGVLRADANGLTVQQSSRTLTVAWRDLSHITFTRAGRGTLSVAAVLRQESATRVPAVFRKKNSIGARELEYSLVARQKSDAFKRANQLDAALRHYALSVYESGIGR